MNSLACYFSHKSKSQFLRVAKYFDPAEIASWSKDSLCSRMLHNKQESGSESYTSYLSILYSPLATMLNLYANISGIDVPRSSAKIFYRIRRSGKWFEMINFKTIMNAFYLKALLFTSFLSQKQFLFFS